MYLLVSILEQTKNFKFLSIIMESIEEIEGSQMGVALTADNWTSPNYLTDLSDDISDISTLVCNYSKKPTRSRKTRERMVNSLIGMLTDANNQLPYLHRRP